MTTPYTEQNSVRTFQPNVDSAELIWHVDFEDREVTIIEPGGWLLQFDNELPKQLEAGQSFFIPKFTWHRIHKGSGPLVISIIKFI